MRPAELARSLAALGYPGLAHILPQRPSLKNPGEVLLAALGASDLEARLVEALPWVAWRHAALDWGWVMREAKVRDLQNRLGFVVSLAHVVAERAGDEQTARVLQGVESELERSRLAREDTLCRALMSEAERRWLEEHRPPLARRWNLLTDWTAEVLRYVA